MSVFDKVKKRKKEESGDLFSKAYADIHSGKTTERVQTLQEQKKTDLYNSTVRSASAQAQFLAKREEAGEFVGSTPWKNAQGTAIRALKMGDEIGGEAVKHNESYLTSLAGSAGTRKQALEGFDEESYQQLLDDLKRYETHGEKSAEDLYTMANDETASEGDRQWANSFAAYKKQEIKEQYDAVIDRLGDPKTPAEDRDALRQQMRELKAQMEAANKAQYQDAAVGDAKYYWEALKTGTANLGNSLAAMFDMIGGTSAMMLPVKGVAGLFGVDAENLDLLNLLYKETDKAADAQNERFDRMTEAKENEPLARFVGAIAQQVPQQVLNLATAVTTGGTSVAAQGLSSSANSGFLSTIQNALQNLIGKPAFWTSFASETGGSYNDAIDSGMDESYAAAAALYTGLINSFIEMGGGLEDLPESVAKGGRNALRKWVVSSLEEGREEILQGIVQRSTAAFYNPETKFAAWDDPNAVFGVKQMAEEGAMGAAVGGILGAPYSIVNARQANRANKQETQFYEQLAGQVSSQPEDLSLLAQNYLNAVEEDPDALDGGTRFPENRFAASGDALSGSFRDAYQTAQKILNRENVSNEEIGKLVFSQRRLELQKKMSQTETETEERRQEFLRQIRGEETVTPTTAEPPVANEKTKTPVRQAVAEFAEELEDLLYNEMGVARTSETRAETQTPHVSEPEAQVSQAVPVKSANADWMEELGLTKKQKPEAVTELQPVMQKKNGSEAAVPQNGMGEEESLQPYDSYGMAAYERHRNSSVPEEVYRKGFDAFYQAGQEQEMSLEDALQEYDGFLAAIGPEAAKAAYNTGVHSAKESAYTRYGRMGIPIESAKAVAVYEDANDEKAKELHKAGLNQRKEAARKAQEPIEKALAEAKKKGAITIEKGHVSKEFRTEEKKLSSKQKAAIRVVEILSETTGLDFVLFESKAYTGMNGKYLNGKIWLDINSGAEGEQAILRTLGHELTHFIEHYSPEAYSEFQEFLFHELNKYDDSTVEMLMLHQQEIAEANGIQLSETAALREVVADACEMMLRDGSALRRLATSNLSTKDKILMHLKELLSKLHEAFRKVESSSREYLLLETARTDLEHLQSMWNEALAYAVAAHAVTQPGATENFDAATNMDGEPAFSYRTWVEDNDREEYRALLQTSGVDVDIDELFKTIDNITADIRENREILDFGWDIDTKHRPFKPVKPNSDPLYKWSIDFSTICRKRLLQQICTERLSAELNRAITKEEGIAIRRALEELRKDGLKIEVACALCYVESARMKSPKQVQRFLDEREEKVRDFLAISNAEFRREVEQKTGEFARDKYGYELGTSMNQMKAPDKKAVKEYKKSLIQGYQPNEAEERILLQAKELPVTEFTTAAGLARLAKNSPELFGAFSAFVRNATHSKGIEADMPFAKGDLAVISNQQIEKLNRENGMRMSSWSDFQVIHVLDYIAAVIELSTRGAKAHAYTKVPDFVRLLGSTGIMTNLSLIPKAKYDGTIEFDPFEGMAWEIARKLRKEFPETAGTVAIGIHDEQIRQLLQNDEIDYVIPYHSSGMSKVTRKQMSIPDWKNYEPVQNEKKMSKDYSNTVHDQNYQEKPMFSEWFDIGEARAYASEFGAQEAMRKMADRYIELCHQRGLEEKFAAFAKEPNYWKLLIDRKMINQETGELIEQHAVLPVFREDSVRRILADEVKRFTEANRDMKAAEEMVLEMARNGKLDIKGARAEIKKTSQWNAAIAAANAYSAEGQHSLRSAFQSPREVLADEFSSKAPGYQQAAQALKGYQETAARLAITKQQLERIEADLETIRSDRRMRASEKRPQELRLHKLRDTAMARISAYESILTEYEARKLNRELTRDHKQALEEEKQKLRDYRSAIRSKKLILSIERNAKSLAKMVYSNYENRIIPDALKIPVGQLLQTLSFDSRKEVNGEILLYQNASFHDILRRVAIAIEALQKDQDLEQNAENDSKSKSLLQRELETQRKLAELTDSESTDTVQPEQEAEADDLVDPKFKNSLFMDIPYELEEEVKELADRWQKRNGDIMEFDVRLAEEEELEVLNKLLSSLSESITNINTFFKNREFKRVEDAILSTLKEYRKANQFEAFMKKQKLSDFLHWDNRTPYYAMKKMGDAAKSIFKELMEGQSKMAFHAQAILKFAKSAWTPQEATEWTKQTFDFAFRDQNFSLSVAQLMSLYATHLRPQGHQHLVQGGFTLPESVHEKEKAHAEPILLYDYEFEIMFAKISPRQKQVVNAMVKFLSTTCAAWGNEISQTRFNIRSFTEESYFPIVTNPNTRNVKDPSQQSTDLLRLVHLSFTKKLNEHANNSIIISNVFDVFATHTADMAKYNAFVLPMIDLLKWASFHESTTDAAKHVHLESVMKSLDVAFGTGAKKYIITLLKDLNGNHEAGVSITDGWTKKAIRNYKIAATMANLRVAALQGTAYLRAKAVLPADSMTRALSAMGDLREVKERMMKYSGEAVWKSMGFYRIDVASNLRDQIRNDGTKAKRFAGKLVELSGKAAELADSNTWAVLWRACELETLKNPKMKAGTKEFFEETEKLFREVIYQTQVMDSTLTRSQLMRENSISATMLTSFMAEPTLTMNQLMDTFYEVHRDMKRKGISWNDAVKKNWKKIGNGILAYTLTSIASGLMESLFDLIRETDDEALDNRLEYFFRKLLANSASNLLPFNKSPILKDFVEAIENVFKGEKYQADRMDMAAISSMTKAIQTISKKIQKGDDSPYTIYGCIYYTVQALSQFTGLPVSNAMRDVASLWNVTAGAFDPDLKIETYRSEATQDATIEKWANLQTKDPAAAKEFLQEFFEQKKADDLKKNPNKPKYEIERDAKSNVRAALTRHFKESYCIAVEEKDSAKTAEIKKLLKDSGYYSDLEKTLSDWVTEYKKKQSYK